MLWIQELQWHIIIQYGIIHSIMSLKLVEQCSVNDGRPTPSHIIDLSCVCLMGNILDHLMLVTEQSKCQ
jgi:hypothetical protein